MGFCLTPCRLDGLLAGAWVALARRDEANWLACRRLAPKVLVASGVAWLTVAVMQRYFGPAGDGPEGLDERLMVIVGIAVLAVFFASLIVLSLECRERSVLVTVLHNKWLRSIGKYSYGMYVFHLLIRYLGVQFLWPVRLAPSFVSKPLGVVWLTAASFVVAWMSYHLYEKHFLGLKRFFAYRAPITTTEGCAGVPVTSVVHAVRSG
jgi:peptidoglycan/LPS O-acetylase OafA/YrhL